MDPARILSRSSLFESFTDTGVAILASIAQVRTVPAGTPLFAQGMVAESLFVLGSGRVRISVRGPDGQDVNLSTIGEGEHLGELALLTSGSARLVTATAETEVTLAEVRQRDFALLQGQKPQACLKLVMAIATSFNKKLSDNRELLGSLLSGAARR